MQFYQAIKNVFAQLADSLELLTDEQYSRQSNILFKASIGQHVRHVIEFFICLDKGYESGTLNYEKRKRDHRIETDRLLALQLLQMVAGNLDKADKGLLLEAGYDEQSDDIATVTTNYYREIIYNLEHTVHHMALIRVGFKEVSAIELPESFGVASSTVKYRRACVQ